ncbi:BBP7 family outer membrane beta-barrel protein [Rhodopirellula sp. JC639]|uniref:BBP7 family outer membrane beta-barrel protein n=1 Tax=Stieleria mannarensis TaxID=2755585 RepID=UPI001601F36F
MPNFQIPRPLTAVLLTALTLSPLGAQTASSQRGDDADHREHVQAARASWTPTRTPSAAKPAVQRSSRTTSVQPKNSRHAQAVRPSQRSNRPSDAAAKRPSEVRQAGHYIPTPPPMEGEIIYESAIVDGSCDAMGPACGCDGVGCDSMGACQPGCGCSLCGELPSGRAWRPALTLSLPQDGWVSFEGLGMWSDGMELPALVTQSPSGTDQADAGVLTRSNTTTLFGGPGRALFDDSRTGWRLRFGFWLDRCHTWGVGADYLELDRESETFSATSTGDPILARPFFNTLTGREDAELVALNNGADIQLTGTVAVTAYSELTGGSVYLRRMTCCDEGCRQWLFCGCAGHYCTRSEFRVGYRFMQLDEGVGISEDLTNNGTFNIGDFDIMDQFDTENQFNGIDLAWNHRLTRGYWTCESLVRLAIGNTRQTVRIAGQTTIVDRNDPNNQTTETYDAGLLALASNSGTHQQDEFSVLPEVNLTLGYQLTDHLKATFGYTGIYWSNVVRPGDHIATMIDTNQLPPAIAGNSDPRPQFAFDTTDYWAHGLTYGLEYRW